MEPSVAFDVRVKNARIAQLVQQYGTLRAVAKAAEVPYCQLCSFGTFRDTPWREGNVLTPTAQKFCDWLSEPPEDVFPQAVYIHFESTPRHALFVRSLGDTLPIHAAMSLPAGDESDPEHALSMKELRTSSLALLETLTPREKRVLKMRFGIGNGLEHTLDEVAAAFDVTRERVHQVEAKALRKLRHPSRSRKLQAFLIGSRV